MPPKSSTPNLAASIKRRLVGESEIDPSQEESNIQRADGNAGTASASAAVQDTTSQNPAINVSSSSDSDLASKFPPKRQERSSSLDRQNRQLHGKEPRQRSLQTVLAQAWCYLQRPVFLAISFPILFSYFLCSWNPGFCGLPSRGVSPGGLELVTDDLNNNMGDVADSAQPTRRRALAVIGGGLAGLSSVISAYEYLSENPPAFPVEILLLDKQSNVGGNSAKASSGFNAVRSAHQLQRNIDDSPDVFLSDTLAAGHGLSDPDLVRILADESAPVLEWLEVQSGLELAALSRCGGHSVPRTHRLKESGKPRAVGWELLSGLAKAARVIESAEGAADANVRIKIMTSVRVVALHSKPVDGALVIASLDYILPNETSEAIYNDPDLLVKPLPSDLTLHNLPVDALILTSGGSSRSPHILSQVPGNDEHPPLDKLPTTNSPFTSGDGIHLAHNLHPKLEAINMEHFQIHPTGFVDPKDPDAVTKMLAPEALRAHGGILLNKHGLRFTNELGRRDDVAGAIFKQLDTSKMTNAQHVFLVLDKQAYQDVGPATMDFYTNTKGNFKLYESLEALAEGIGCPLESLEQTISDYSSHAQSNTPDTFGKTVFPTNFTEGPFRAAMITPVLHYSPGGIPFLPSGELVSKSKEQVVKSLWGAGEVTGGVHGGGRLAGNSLAECGVWGRRAGKGAAAGLV